ncbi:helix-turn-helix domain-containing protein [Limosilactobacillus mucosae]|uniref:helix-turn-helix domain-containing protein n=1 Tax=Limosilactobacillus mucosae TaxID=97478 RepID=UPI003EBC51F8
MSIAERIKEYRKQRHYTQKELATLINVKPTTVSGWELGRNTPSIEMLKKLADILNVSFDELAGVESNSYSSNVSNKDEKPLTKNQKLIAYSIDPDISDEERQAIIEMVQAAKKFRRRI